MSHAGSDAVFDFLRVCSHGVRFIFGVRLPAPSQGPPPKRLSALYTRIQVALPPPDRLDELPWKFGIRVKDGEEAEGTPFEPVTGDPGWKERGVFQVKGIPPLDQPEPSTLVVDQWLTVPAAQADPTTVTFTEAVDERGFLSAWYPQPKLDESGVKQVPVDYYGEYDIQWPAPLPPDSWLAISFDRFSPPERESVEYIAQVGDCVPPHD